MWLIYQKNFINYKTNPFTVVLQNNQDTDKITSVLSKTLNVNFTVRGLSKKLYNKNSLKATLYSPFHMYMKVLNYVSHTYSIRVWYIYQTQKVCNLDRYIFSFYEICTSLWYNLTSSLDAAWIPWLNWLWK